MTQRRPQGTAVLTAVMIGATLAATASCTANKEPVQDRHPQQHGAKQREGAQGGNRDVPQAAPSAAGGRAAPRAFTLVASGDVLPHASIISQANADAGGSGYDFVPMLSGRRTRRVRGRSGDLSHGDGLRRGRRLHRLPEPSSRRPRSPAPCKATGYDSCSTASNHTLDDGADGGAPDARRAGQGRRRARGFGAARPPRARRPPGCSAGGAKVAQLAYTYGTNDIPLPKGKPWTVNLIERERIVADARAARKAGADVVVVALHWGTEWQDEPDLQQLSLGKQLTASADRRAAPTST